MITGNDPGRPGEDINQRLERIEQKLENSRRGGGGLGCCGGFLMIWVIYLLYQILDKVG